MPRGGARPNSGPKPLPPGEKKQPYTTKLDPELLAYLRSLGHGNAAPEIDRCLRASKGFREWKQKG